MKPKVYLETTIVSYLIARPSRDLITAAHQHIRMVQMSATELRALGQRLREWRAAEA
jgi:hypothetical protein